MPISITDEPTKPRTNSIGYDNITSNVNIVNNTETTHSSVSPTLLIDLSVSINDSINQGLREPSVQLRTTHGFHFPENDMSALKNQYVSSPSNQECLFSNIENANFNKTTAKVTNGLDKITSETHCEQNCFPESIMKQDGPSSLSSKSFTGSLNDIYTESTKGIQSPGLIRQRSYTVLEPSPQLIAHLEVQSLSKGVDVTSISMSESCSHLNSTVKKRRSWDLESAKVKWSSMARELNQKKIQNIAGYKSKQAKSTTKQTDSQNATKNIHNRGKESSEGQKKIPTKNNLMLMISNNNHQHTKEDSPYKFSTRTYKLPKRDEQKFSHKDEPKDKTLSVQNTTPLLKSSIDDPGTRVRELYEKVQKQQSMQMATLMEKQKESRNFKSSV
ncbi:hypothetical protein EVAR_83256_1 [Eumeta japonica]|uniref:Uncharacterized protein n=1 Tax=Eumeta variegata TaxID=151549 RepID=A0A4C1XB65_EUMVA|nr:hypothetical protein EVAR_83256_1 [Eumeta japonica]